MEDKIGTLIFEERLDSHNKNIATRLSFFGCKKVEVYLNSVYLDNTIKTQCDIECLEKGNQISYWDIEHAASILATEKMLRRFVSDYSISQAPITLSNGFGNQQICIAYNDVAVSAVLRMNEQKFPRNCLKACKKRRHSGYSTHSKHFYNQHVTSFDV